MASFNKIQQFVEDLAFGVHDFTNTASSVPTVALTTNANAPLATNSVLADLTEIVYTNLSARAITISASAQTTGTYKLTYADLVLTASGAVATFRFVAIYADAPTSPIDPLIAFYDHGSDVTLATSDTYTIDFSDSNGFLQIA